MPKAKATLWLLTAMIATGCITDDRPSPTPIKTAEEARRIALDTFPSSVPVTVVSIKLTTVAAAMQGAAGADPDEPAWRLVLSGSFYDEMCGPIKIAPPECPPQYTSALVVIAARGGEIWASMPFP